MSIRGCNVFGSGLMESRACWQVILAFRCEGKSTSLCGVMDRGNGIDI